MKIFISTVFVVVATLAVQRTDAQNITNFGETVGSGPFVYPGSTWSYNGTTSTVSGTNANGNELFGTFSSVTDFSGSNQINLTATVNGVGAPGSSFLFTLVGQTGATASAVFSWPDFLSPGGTVSAPLTPIVPGTMQNVNYWQIVSLYNDVGGPLPIDVTFSNANASAGTVPVPGIGGSLLAGFGASATTSGSWTYSQGSSTISGNTTYGDSISGTSSLTNYSNNPTQISLTANANVPLGTPFTYVLTDNTGAHAYAAFNWANFNGGVKTVTSQLTTDIFFDPTNVVGWQILSGASNTTINATIYGAAAVSPTQVETPADNFSVGITTINVNSSNPSALVSSTVDVGGFSGATRNVQAFSTGTSQLQLQINGGALSVAAVNPGGPEVAEFTLLYSGFTLYAPDQTFLRFDFNQVENLDILDIEIISANGISPIGGIFSVPDQAGATSLFVDLTLLSGWSPEFMAGINQMTFAFGSTTPDYFFTLDRISFTPVPEPSSCALIFSGLLALLSWHRNLRRRTGSC